jgi:hypothetical protein
MHLCSHHANILTYYIISHPILSNHTSIISSHKVSHEIKTYCSVLIHIHIVSFETQIKPCSSHVWCSNFELPSKGLIEQVAKPGQHQRYVSKWRGLAGTIFSKICDVKAFPDVSTIPHWRRCWSSMEFSVGLLLSNVF